MSEEHKQKWRQDQQRPIPGVFRDRRSATTTIVMAAPPFVEPDSWPNVLPPFLLDALTFATDGTLWIERTTAAGAPATHDRFGLVGERLDQIVLPPRSRLVGFGASSIYIVKIDDDDVEHLQRYPMP